MKIDLQTVLAEFRRSALGFRKALDDLEAEWTPEPIPPTTAMSKLAVALTASLDTLGSDVLERLFSTIEEALVNGDELTKDVIATGFLEELLSQSSGGSLDLRRISQFLGKESVNYCRAWDEFTGLSTDGI